MKRLSIYLLAGVAALTTSCSDFLDTLPNDAMSPATTWKTETDVESFVVGCYNGLLDGGSILYMDCGSDIGYNNFPWEGYRAMGDGSLASGDESQASFYNFSIIRRCNTVLDNIDKVTFTDEKKKKDLIAQVKAIRAYRYFIMNWWYGGVPIIGTYNTAEEAQVPRNSEAEVREQVAKDLKDAIADINETPEARGRIAKGAVLAIKMREALYYGDWKEAKTAAQDIIDLKQYELEKGEPDSYAKLFKLSGTASKEIILADQRIANLFGLGTIGQMYNNADAGWSSIVPTQNLVDMYEMKTGLTKEEAGNAYDPVHPFADRDPRMAMTILYPGRDWRGAVLNTLDKTVYDKEAKKDVDNKNFPTYTDNASKTALTWAKYLDPIDQYSNIWDTGACPIVFRYAEVLLTYAEAANELDGPSDVIYGYLNDIRNRAGMPDVDKAKYNTKEKLRELIRRERAVELAGEGLRRADILRWKDASGKMLAETVLNGPLYRISGKIDYNEQDPYKRAVVDADYKKKDNEIEIRKFATKNRYLPIRQTVLDKNPKLKQNDGY